MLSTDQHETGEILSVGQLNRSILHLLESHFSCVWVEAEIADFKQPSSGHFYFTLKDEQNDSQIRCVMFRNKHRDLHFTPSSGMKILARGQISVYQPRGDYQLLIEYMEESGLGALQRAFDKLKQRLYTEGLFSLETKKALPLYPKQIGVITSPRGAAIHDILTTLKRRNPSIPVIIYPSLVQGELAAAQLCHAITLANQRAECDVLIIGRGGGSLEDLWPFNDERVARAMFASHIPIVSAIGHEIDVTIADFVADVRAPTPTAAAELLSPEQRNQLSELSQHKQSLIHTITYWLQQQIQDIDMLSQRLSDPRQQLREAAVACTHLWQSLQLQIKQCLDRRTHSYQLLANQLNTLSPLATLHRGYAIARLSTDNTLIRSVSQVTNHDQVAINVSDGIIQTRVVNSHTKKQV